MWRAERLTAGAKSRTHGRSVCLRSEGLLVGREGSPMRQSREALPIRPFSSPEFHKRAPRGAMLGAARQDAPGIPPRHTSARIAKTCSSAEPYPANSTTVISRARSSGGARRRIRARPCR